jgi:hypothetical protein
MGEELTYSTCGRVVFFRTAEARWQYLSGTATQWCRCLACNVNWEHFQQQNAVLQKEFFEAIAVEVPTDAQLAATEKVVMELLAGFGKAGCSDMPHYVWNWHLVFQVLEKRDGGREMQQYKLLKKAEEVALVCLGADNPLLPPIQGELVRYKSRALAALRQGQAEKE